MAFDYDPVGSGFVASLAKPGGNITGISGTNPELSGKRLEFLKQAVPHLSRVAGTPASRVRRSCGRRRRRVAVWGCSNKSCRSRVHLIWKQRYKPQQNGEPEA